MTVILVLLLLVFAGVQMPRPLRDTPIDHQVQALKTGVDHRIDRYRCEKAAAPCDGEAGS